MQSIDIDMLSLREIIYFLKIGGRFISLKSFILLAFNTDLED